MPKVTKLKKLVPLCLFFLFLFYSHYARAEVGFKATRIGGSAKIELSGITFPWATLIGLWGDIPVAVGLLNSAGTFSFSWEQLLTSDLSLIARDRYGLVTSRWSLNSSGANNIFLSPTISVVSEQSQARIFGSAGGQIVKIFREDETIAEAPIDNSGYWEKVVERPAGLGFKIYARSFLDGRQSAASREVFLESVPLALVTDTVEQVENLVIAAVQGVAIPIGMASEFVDSGALEINLPSIQESPTFIAVNKATAASLVGASAALTAIPMAFSFLDKFLVIVKSFLNFPLLAINALFARRKKIKPWGIVFDSLTKKPIDPAIVRLFQGKKMVAQKVTDMDGRYGFLVSPGLYRLEVERTNYRFPSEKFKLTQSLLYPNLYYGEEFEVKTPDVIDMNIPLDPLNFDWNQKVKQVRRAEFSNKIADSINKFFMVFGVVNNAFIFPNSNYLKLFLLLILANFLINRKTKKWAKVIDKKSGRGISFAIVRLFYAKFNKEAGKEVCDALGRYQFLISPGVYYLTVEKKTEGFGSNDKVESYARIYQSSPFTIKGKSWIGVDIKV